MDNITDISTNIEINKTNTIEEEWKFLVRYYLPLTLETLDDICEEFELTKSNETAKRIREITLQGKCKNCGNEFSKSFNAINQSRGPYCQSCVTINKSMILHGVKNQLISPKANLKRVKTVRDKYGTDNVFQIKEICEKIKQDLLTKTGYDNCMKNPETKKRRRELCFKRHGVSSVMQIPHTRFDNLPVTIKRREETCLKKYGVSNPMQISEIAEKCMLSGVTKEYTLPDSGDIMLIDGYEHHALNYLFQFYGEEDIAIGRRNVPEIWYDFDNKKRRYYTDIYIRSENKCIEVKSTYTFEWKKEQNLAKQQAVKDSGIDCEIWIYIENTKTFQIIY